MSVATFLFTDIEVDTALGGRPRCHAGSAGNP